jgi:ABC-type uncharacterized transport system substrate-binding protein
MAIYIRRREFITALGGAAMWPFAARAQQAEGMPRIGFLHSASLDPWRRELVSAFRLGLKERGYSEGQNVAIEYRWAESKIDRLSALAGELARLPLAAIAATNTPAALAAMTATKTIPIVFVTAGNPVELGLVTSFNRPGGNVTGLAVLGGELAAKQLELLKEIALGTGRIAVLVNHPGLAERTINDVQLAAHALGLQIDVLHASTPPELERAIATVAQQGIGALLVNPDGFFISRREQLVALAESNKIPAVYSYRDFVTAGGLMSYGSSLTDAFRQAGLYTGRILKGEKPSDLPVLQPTKFELVINRKTAKALGIDVPAKVLALADEVVE